MDTLDYLLLNRPISIDDQSMAFDRVIADVTSPVVCFLPWRVPMPLARNFGLIPDSYLACYELPNALVGSVPERCVEALTLLVDDAMGLLSRYKVHQATIVGLSAGSGPANVVAELAGARLCSVASADRGDLMLWESRAACEIKLRAISRGYGLEDFRLAFEGYNPIENLGNIRRDSVFVVCDQDPFVPTARSRGLVERVQRSLPGASVVRSTRGHVRTLRGAIRHLPELLSSARASIGCQSASKNDPGSACNVDPYGACTVRL